MRHAASDTIMRGAAQNANKKRVIVEMRGQYVFECREQNLYRYDYDTRADADHIRDIVVIADRRRCTCALLNIKDMCTKENR